MDSPATTLYRAKRSLDKARDVLSKVLLDSQSRTDTKAWTELYYFFPNAANCGGFERRVAAFKASLTGEPVPAFGQAVEAILANYVTVGAAQLALAEARAARKTKLAAKAAQKADLGVDLAKKGGARATPATYAALRAGLKPVEAELAAWISTGMQEQQARIVERLQGANWRLDDAFPHEDSMGNRLPGAYSAPPRFHLFFVMNSESLAKRKPGIDVAATAAKVAAAEADEALAGFCGKLAGKVDGAIEAECAGAAVHAVAAKIHSDIWSNSVITVDLTGGGQQVWHTRVIWNRSVLNTEFQQWPTRRVS